MCGEGGEYETCVLDCPLFPTHRIEVETRVASEHPEVEFVTLDPFPDAPVAYIKFSADKCHIVEKDEATREAHAALLHTRLVETTDKEKYQAQA